MTKSNKIILLSVIMFVVLLLAFLGKLNTPTVEKEPYVKDIVVENVDIHEVYDEQKGTEQKIDEPNVTQIVENSEEVTVAGVTEEEINNTCALYIRCDTVLENIQKFDTNKTSVIPKDGIVYQNSNVEISEGDSVFDILQREMTKNRIHLEFTKTPVYNSVYIEGIANIYEFDYGDLSGWMYRVNGKMPSCGCSSYLVNSGDVVEFLYSCNLGADLGIYKKPIGD